MLGALWALCAPPGQVVCTTLTGVGARQLDRLQFDVVVVDEAAQVWRRCLQWLCALYLCACIAVWGSFDGASQVAQVQQIFSLPWLRIWLISWRCVQRWDQ